MLTIRPALIDDAALLMRFVRELAIYEKAEHEVLATEEDLRRDIFGPDTRVEALICEEDGEPIGHASYFMNYSTWLGKYGIFLEELYVTPDRRGNGAGKQMLQHIAALAVERGCGRFEWNVLDWNEPAIKFYEALGAKDQSEWVGYRLTGDALRALAGSGGGA